jgi:hypothetical protein
MISSPAFFKNSKAGPVMGYEQSGHGRFSHPDAHPIARDAWLRDFKDRAANPVSVADAHLVICQPLDREVLAELTHFEIAAAKVGFPIAIRVHLVDHDSAMLSAVPGKIA